MWEEGLFKPMIYAFDGMQRDVLFSWVWYPYRVAKYSEKNLFYPSKYLL